MNLPEAWKALLLWRERLSTGWMAPDPHPEYSRLDRMDGLR